MLNLNFDIQLYNPIQTVPHIVTEKYTFLVILDNIESESDLIDFIVLFFNKYKGDRSVLSLLYLKENQDEFLSLLSQLPDDEDNPDIDILTEILLEVDMPGLFASCHTYVAISPNEKYVYQAMSMNKHIICTEKTMTSIAEQSELGPFNLIQDENSLAKKRTAQTRQLLLEHINQRTAPANTLPEWQYALNLLKLSRDEEAYEFCLGLLNKNTSLTNLVVCQKVFQKCRNDELAKSLESQIQNAIDLIDPTLIPCGTYNQNIERAISIYSSAFRIGFEYMTNSNISGSIIEFGTYTGFSARQLAKLISEYKLDSSLILFDSFEGLPEIESGDLNSYAVADQGWLEGAMLLPQNIAKRIKTCLSGIIHPNQIQIHKGYFKNTLNSAKIVTPPAIINLDCDLYSSAKEVLDYFLSRELLQDGALLYCDDYNCNRANPNMGERKALSEAFASQTRYSFSHFLNYGWHGQAFFIHDKHKK